MTSKQPRLPEEKYSSGLSRATVQNVHICTTSRTLNGGQGLERGLSGEQISSAIRRLRSVNGCSLGLRRKGALSNLTTAHTTTATLFVN